MGHLARSLGVRYICLATYRDVERLERSGRYQVEADRFVDRDVLRSAGLFEDTLIRSSSPFMTVLELPRICTWQIITTQDRALRLGRSPERQENNPLDSYHFEFCSAICFIIPANPPPGLTRTSERCRAGEPVEVGLLAGEGEAFLVFDPEGVEPGGVGFDVGFGFGRDWVDGIEEPGTCSAGLVVVLD